MIWSAWAMVLTRWAMMSTALPATSSVSYTHLDVYKRQVDRSGNIVGDPIVGAITEKKQAETLQKLIDQALAADMG